MGVAQEGLLGHWWEEAILQITDADELCCDVPSSCGAVPCCAQVARSKFIVEAQVTKSEESHKACKYIITV